MSENIQNESILEHLPGFELSEAEPQAISDGVAASGDFADAIGNYF